MVIAIVLGIVATAVALIGLLGRAASGQARVSQLIVYALPLGLVAYGYAASVGITLGWALVAAVSAVLAILAGGLLGHQPAVSDQQTRPGAAGLNLVCSGLISLGLGAITILWASHMIAAFSYLDRTVVGIVLTLAALAFSVGGRSVVGLSRAVVVVLIIGAVGMLGVGYLLGDPSGLGDPVVPVPALSATDAILFAIGVIIIGAGYPVMRSAGANNRGRVIVAAIAVALISLVTVVGMLILYGGAFNLPSLVMNVLPVYTPDEIGAVVSALLALISTVIAGATIHTAAKYVGIVHPKLLVASDRTLGSPRLWVNVALGVIMIIILWLAPTPSWIVGLMAVVAVINLAAEATITRAAKRAGAGAASSGEAANAPSVAG